MMDEPNTEAEENGQVDAAAEDSDANAQAHTAEDGTGGDADENGADGRSADAAAVQAPQYEEMTTAAPAASLHPSLDIVLDVPVTISLEVGKATMSVGDLIRLGQGAVVELDRAVGEPLDVMVNGALVAHGEIVLVNEKFGIRLTSVVAPAGNAMKKAS